MIQVIWAIRSINFYFISCTPSGKIMFEILFTSMSLSNQGILKFQSRDYYSVSELQFSSAITALSKLYFLIR